MGATRRSPLPTSKVRDWQVLLPPAPTRHVVQRVDIRSARRCVDGQYWVHRPGDHTLWARTTNKEELWHPFLNLFFGYLLLGMALQAARRCRGVTRPDSAVQGKLTDKSAWYQLPKGAGTHAAKKAVPDAQRAEPWMLPGWFSLATFTGATAAAFAALVITFLITDFSIFPTWTGVLATIAAFVVANAAITGNQELSRLHRAKLRRHGVALTGEIADCSTRFDLRPTAAQEFSGSS